MAVDPAESVGALLRRAGTAVLDAYEHQSCTFGRLLSKLAITRDASRLPLVSVQFNIDSPIALADLAAPAWTCRCAPTRARSRTSSCSSTPRRPAARSCSSASTTPTCSTPRPCSAGSTCTARCWSAPWRSRPRRSGNSSARRVPTANGSRPSTRPRCLSGRPAHRGAGVGRVAPPDAVAIVAGDSRLTYRELEQRANAVAAALAERGVGARQLVGMACGRNVGLLAGMLGILKTGAAYAPLDPASRKAARPHGRGRRAHLRGHRPHGHAAGARPLPDAACRRTCAAGDCLRGATCNRRLRDHTPAPPASPRAWPCRSVRCRTSSPAWRADQACGDDRLVAVTTTSFDIAVLELFLPLTLGAQVIIADRESVLDGQRLRALIEARCHRAAGHAIGLARADRGRLGRPRPLQGAGGRRAAR